MTIQPSDQFTALPKDIQLLIISIHDPMIVTFSRVSRWYAQWLEPIYLSVIGDRPITPNEMHLRDIVRCPIKTYVSHRRNVYQAYIYCSLQIDNTTVRIIKQVMLNANGHVTITDMNLVDYWSKYPSGLRPGGSLRCWKVIGVSRVEPSVNKLTLITVKRDSYVGLMTGTKNTARPTQAAPVTNGQSFVPT